MTAATDADTLADFVCEVCEGQILATEVIGGFRRHMPDLDAPEPPGMPTAFDSRYDPGRAMVARQRHACATGRARAATAYRRTVQPGRWLVTGTDMEDPYPCRCGEFGDDAWAHAHRCACKGREDGMLMPPSCCGHIKPPADEAPPPTLGELRQVLIDYELARPRSRQQSLGPSELGTPCLAQIVRKLGHYPRLPVTEPSWAPFIGTAVHAEMEKVIAHWNATIGRERFVTEDELHCGDDIVGHGDAYDCDSGTVIDWKVTGKTALDKLLRAQGKGLSPAEQVSTEYRVQAHLYGAGHAAKGRHVRWVRLVLLARSWRYDESAEWTERYDPGIAAAAVDRYVQAKGVATAMELDAHPERIALIPRTPSAHACAWCPFYRPTMPNNSDGCPGDEAKTAAALDRFEHGLIAATTAHDVV